MISTMVRKMNLEDKLLTYTHLGEFSITAKELEWQTLNVRKQVERDFKEKILLLLLEKNRDELKKYTGCCQIKYRRKTFLEKLLHFKKHPVVILTKPFDDLITGFPEIRQNYQELLDNLECEFKRKIGDIKRQKDDDLKVKEKAQRFRDTPFQDNPDSSTAAVNPEHICLVHATKYFPKKNKKGEYEIETLAMASHLKNPRNTIHFACNHHVESHMAGAWDDMPYVILTPMVETSKLNGRNPMGISAVDTFYEMDVGEKLRLPESAFLIYPASDAVQFQENQFTKTGKSHAVYKTKFSSKERDFLKKAYAYEISFVENGHTGAFEKRSFEEQDKFLAALIKKELVRSKLREMGYAIDLNQGDENDKRSPLNKVSRLGKRLKVASSPGQALHSMTIFGINGINHWMDRYSPDNIGNTVDFMYAVTHQKGTLKDEDGVYVFIDDKNQRHVCRLPELEQVFMDKSDSGYLQKGLEFIKTSLEQRPNLKTTRSEHVLEAWSRHQQNLWNQSATDFFKAYPTVEKFKAIFKEKSSVKIVPKKHSLPQKADTRTH